MVYAFIVILSNQLSSLYEPINNAIMVNLQDMNKLTNTVVLAVFYKQLLTAKRQWAYFKNFSGREHIKCDYTLTLVTHQIKRHNYTEDVCQSWVLFLAVRALW